eukprot:TRINITY_DN729_c0_g1_i1.p1 TRINITY_DN729_c0_g1~~TRINITY_DN729_c0_g1_i1.p1  ORF type:complete len:1351 (+),score=347.08 TRINITY_DN729_c0_g1_i1:6541-10593(+)
MPANEEYLRSPKLMHQVFCGSALALLVITVWMMQADFGDEWRGYQRAAFKLQADRLKAREASMRSDPAHEAKVADAMERRAKADEYLKTVAKEEHVREEAVRVARDNEANHLRALKLERAKRDVARANYNLGIRDSLPSEQLAALESKYKEIETRVDGMEIKFAELKQTTVDAKAYLSEMTGKRDEAEKDLKAEDANIVLIHAAREKIDPDYGTLAYYKRKLMLVPIIEGFNSPERITQDWMPGLQFTLGGMTNVARFDRCRTCHSNIDTVDDTVKTSVAGAFPHGDATKDGKFKHPFSSHPNLGLFLSATSPHPLPKFGCTVCHEGQGSGTSFQNASHTPNDPAQMAKWADDHKWFDNHYWERPMSPKRFEESNCIKCHINVVELGTNEKFGATAPKVVHGHNLVQKFGCFGCHEISGYDGPKIIGPDLRLEPTTAEEAAEIAKDPNQVAGKMRKVGPSLRHLASKADAGFVANWTEEPKRFRPTTRMPQFFKLDNQTDHLAGQYNPVEIAAMTHYLEKKSETLETMSPADGYKPNAERGREFFATKGCVVCHSHHEVPGLNADFGPELSRVHAKLRAGKVGFDWLYTWIREPERHHPRTKMPHLFLDAEGTGENAVDPAADIAAFLLKLEGAPSDFKPTAEFAAPEAPDEVLDKLVSYFLLKVLTETQVKKLMESGEYPVPAEKIKGDEIELAGEPVGANPTEFRNRKLNYLGRKSISRYGCYGCHDIPNFEKARPIGTALQDWGKKDRSRLAFEHIHEYLHHHGQAALGITVESVDDAAAARLKLETAAGVRVSKAGKTQFKYDDVVLALDGVPVNDTAAYEARLATTVVGSKVAVTVWRAGKELPEPIVVTADSSMLDRVETAIGRAERGEYDTPEEKERELSAAFYYESLTHHGRPGFLWQKLRQPRSYDYKMIETKPYDDRLRMPKFPFSEDDIDAIATFVVGLVAEPPSPEYMYNPTGAAGARIQGEKLIQQYNCAGCHMLELPKIRYGADVDQITASDQSVEYPEAIALLNKLRPQQNGLTGEMKSVKTEEGIKKLPIVQFHGMVAATPDPADDPADQEYVVESWENLTVAGKDLLPTYKFIFPAANLDKIIPAQGGAYAEWLVKRLVDNKTAKEPALAWQMSPPPLYKEGTKVQTPWLFNFLRNPGRIRHTTVLRMPKFNMSDTEAQALANYFAAVDGAEFPYQLIAEREPAYLNAKNNEFHKEFPDKKGDYLQESWQMLNAPLCIKCHSVAGRQVSISDPKTDIRGPNLELVAERLKPDWTLLWLYRPQWITPYTSMPAPLPPQQAGGQPRYPEIFGGDGSRQTVSLRDALVNYYKLMEKEGKVANEPPKPQATGAGGDD